MFKQLFIDEEQIGLGPLYNLLDFTTLQKMFLLTLAHPDKRRPVTVPMYGRHYFQRQAFRVLS